MKKQLDLALMGDVSYPCKHVPEQHLYVFQDIAEVYRYTANHSVIKRSHKTWAQLLDISRSYFTQLLNSDTSDSPKNMSGDLEQRFMRLAGNRAPIQWRELELDGKLYHQRDDQETIQELEARLAEMRARA